MSGRGARRLLVLAAGAWLVTVGALGPARAADAWPALNERCPVMPEEPADPRWQVAHRGRAIAFCCSSCVETFRAAPDRYFDELEARERGPLGPAVDAARWIGAHPAIGIYLGLTAVVFAAARAARRRESLRERPAVALAGHPAALAIAVQAGLLVHLLAGPAAPRGPTEKQADLPETIVRLQLARYGAFFAGGPRPENPFVRTYYRGNDERSPRLPFGGAYRTADMTVSLLTEDGTPFTPGMKPDAHRLALRLEVVRAPHAAPQLFEPKMLAQAMLTRRYDVPPDDAVHLTTVEPGERWEAVYPLPKDAFSFGSTTVLVRMRTAIHYAVLVDIVTDAQGRALPSSNLLMASVIEALVPRGEWLNVEPIPELTGPNIDDPALLGVSDYLPPERER